MADLPHPDRVRALLTDKRRTPADQDASGDAFLEAGRPDVALMFYERSRSADRLDRILRLAREKGDGFLAEGVARAAPEKVAPADWEAVAEAAVRLGKFAFARDAYRRLGDETRAADAARRLAEALDARPGQGAASSS